MKRTNPALFDTGEQEASSRCFAEVIIPLALPKTYTYAVPENFISHIKVGCRVEVTLGQHKRYAGIVKAITLEKPAYPTKMIQNLLDEEPLLHDHQLKFWSWLSHYYMCTEGEVMAAALPAHFKLSSETIVVYNENFDGDFSELNASEYVVAEALEIRRQLNIKEVQQLLDANHVYPILKRLIDKKICLVWESLNEKFKARQEQFVLLHSDFADEQALAALLNSWTKAPKQLELLLSYLHLLKTEGFVTQSALLKKSGASSAQLKGLIEKNILRIERRVVDRISMLQKQMETRFELSEAQSRALHELKNKLSQKKVCLLHGVTGSGKTQIYIKLIEAYFNQGKQVLYLLPEIALTAQMIRRLQLYFGGNIAIYHSRFSNNERVELWNKVKSGEIKIVLGARSSLFLPFGQLGLVIVDEEHDPSFKQQDPAPRYHARDAAVYYAASFSADVVLGSATPSIETYFNVQKGKYGLVELNERYGGMMLPQIELVDVKKITQKGKVMLSPSLRTAMEAAVQGGRQVILFQNRRGYAPYVICGTCSFLPQCQHCDVTLTLHKYSNRMQCHYCGTAYPKLVACPACGSVHWTEKNFGTEKIEEIIENEFPQFRVARMDVDSVKGKTAHDNLIKLFEQQKLDVLVGTQMVVKGLDFEKVSLIGILDADGLLSFADFRVNERAFQLMEQVSGRAGRKDTPGKVLIQTSMLQHPVIRFLTNHDYKGMFAYELENRKQFQYPPFCRIIKITLKHKVKEIVDKAAEKLSSRLKQELTASLMGPTAPAISRVRNYYLMELLVKLPLHQEHIIRCKAIIKNEFNLLQTETSFKSLQMIADVDPN